MNTELATGLRRLVAAMRESGTTVAEFGEYWFGNHATPPAPQCAGSDHERDEYGCGDCPRCAVEHGPGGCCARRYCCGGAECDRARALLA